MNDIVGFLCLDGRCDEKKFLFCNCNIFNWKELNLKFGFCAKSGDGFLFLFLEKFGLKFVDELKGDYAIVYFDGEKLFLLRDVVGVKTLCYFVDESKFYFASYKKDLPRGAVELNPRKFVVFDLKKRNLDILDREKYYCSKKINDDNFLMVKENVKKLFVNSVRRLVDGSCEKVGVLFSGGTDSTFMAFVLQGLGVDFICYTASVVGGNIEEGCDVVYARKIARECGFEWRVVEVELEKVPEYSRRIMGIIEDRDYTKVSVALPLFVALEEARKDGVFCVFIGIGSEEVFADYKRGVDVDDVNEICVEGLKSLWVRDLYRDNALANYNNVDLKFPFLDDDFVDYCIRIDSKFKINKKMGVNKVVIRDILRDFGLSEEFVCRLKSAAQYGSKSDRVYEKLARKNRMKKQEYLDDL